MDRQRIQQVAALLLLGAASVALLGGCGQSQAKPLELTYFYLPG